MEREVLQYKDEDHGDCKSKSQYYLSPVLFEFVSLLLTVVLLTQPSPSGLNIVCL